MNGLDTLLKFEYRDMKDSSVSSFKEHFKKMGIKISPSPKMSSKNATLIVNEGNNGTTFLVVPMSQNYFVDYDFASLHENYVLKSQNQRGRVSYVKTRDGGDTLYFIRCNRETPWDLENPYPSSLTQ